MYTFTYETEDDNVIEPRVEMVIPDGINLDEMLGFFQRFLLASGYFLDSDERLEFVKPESKLENTISVGEVMIKGFAAPQYPFEDSFS